jgi:hypothetical protein
MENNLRTILFNQNVKDLMKKDTRTMDVSSNHVKCNIKLIQSNQVFLLSISQALIKVIQVRILLEVVI